MRTNLFNWTLKNRLIIVCNEIFHFLEDVESTELSIKIDDTIIEIKSASNFLKSTHKCGPYEIEYDLGVNKLTVMLLKKDKTIYKKTQKGGVVTIIM
jgi:hypothetical protein